MGRRVLLVNPAKEDDFPIDRIHIGLTLIGEILASNGHQVKIMDYAFLRCLKVRIKVPDIEQVIYEFEPDIIGVSVFTYVYDECQELIARISRCCDAVIILGGPHMTMFSEDFSNDRRINYIVRGEAEKIILDLVQTARRGQCPVIVNCPPPSPNDIPAINLDIVYASRYVRTYQIQLSRGCPYNCTFCNVRLIAGHRVRARALETCLAQIVEAKRRYPNIEVIIITDDCPTFDKERFKRFLQMFKKAGIGCALLVDNVRANLVDEEMIQLYVAAGGYNICLGVESGDPEVFKLVNKGESIEDIIKIAKLVRKYGLLLGLCFVIGLPGDNPERHQHSLRLAKDLKPDYVFWNMCVPWPGTVVNQWYQTQGEIGDMRNFSTLIDPEVNFKEPVCSSPGFPKEEMIKAWLAANMETYSFSSRCFRRLFSEAWKNKLYRSFFIYATGYFPYRIRSRLIQIRRNLKQFGFGFVILKLVRKIKKKIALNRYIYIC